MQKKVVIGAILAVIVLAVLLVVFVFLRPKSTPYEPLLPLKQLNLSSETTVLMADSREKPYVSRFMQYLANANESVMYLGPEYFSQCKAQQRVILTGTEGSRTKEVIAGLIGERFNETRRYMLIKSDMNFEGQQFIIFYAQTEDELQKMVEDSISLKETTVRHSLVAEPMIFPKEPPKITSNSITGNTIVTCTPQYTTTQIDFNERIFNNLGFYLDTGLQRFNSDNYLRLQVYDPFAASRFQGILPKPGYKGFKDYVKQIVQDIKEQGLVKVTVTCRDCGQSYEMVYNAVNFRTLDFMQEGWLENMATDFCTECLGSPLNMSVETINMTQAINDFIEDRISPESIMDKVVGKTDDVYDSLPKGYTYKVICPDTVPKVVVTVLLPVYVDKEGNMIEYTMNLTTLLPKIAIEDIASYSDPVSFNTVILPHPYINLWYYHTPEYDIYYAANISSSPEGLIKNERFFYTGIKSIQAAPLVKQGDSMYRFHYWKINQHSFRETNTLFLDGWYANAVAYYEYVSDESAPAEQGKPDLVVRFANASEEGDTLKVNFIVRNEGTAGMTEGFETNMLFEGVAMDKVITAENLPVDGSVEIRKEYNLSKIFDDTATEYTVGASVDPIDEIKELSEYNNKFSLKLQRSKADLIFTGMEVSPEEPKKGDEISVDVFFENAGERRITEAEVELESGNEKWGTQYIVLLDPGKKGSLTFSKTIDRCGKYSLTARFSDVVPKNEQQSNNWQKTTFEIDCEEYTCEDQKDPYSCAGSTCASGTSCIWDSASSSCTCSEAIEKTCLKACQPGLGTCNRECPYPNTYHQEIGDSWCQSDRMDDEYMCCCNV